MPRSLYHLEKDAQGNRAPLTNGSEGSVLEYVLGLSDQGIEVKTLNLPYGHDWVLWRKLIVHVFDNILWK